MGPIKTENAIKRICRINVHLRLIRVEMATGEMTSTKYRRWLDSFIL